MSQQFTRREAVAVAAVGAVLTTFAASSSAREPQDGTPSSNAAALLAPLTAGATLGRWTIRAIHPPTTGALRVELGDSAGAAFSLDICARDRAAGAPSSPACSELYEIFAANQGNGSTPTLEDHGLAAMTLAEVVRANESHVVVRDVLTQRERLVRFRELLGS